MERLARDGGGLWVVGASACIAACQLVGGCAGGSRSAGEVGKDLNASLAQARSLAAQGQEAQASGDLSRAINLYGRATNSAPDFGAAWNNMGIALMERKGDTDFVASAQAFQRASALLPRDATPSRNLGLLYQSRGFQEDALGYFEQALVIDPNDRDSLRGAAVCGKVLGRSDQAALERLRRAQLSETDPKWAGVIARERMRVEQELLDRRDRL